MKIRLEKTVILIDNMDQYLPIRKLKPGETVTGLDEVTGKYIKNTITTIEKIKVRNDDFYIINDRHWFYKNQSLYVNGRVDHAFNIKIGDKLTGFFGKEIEVVSIQKINQTGYFNRFTIDGNHTYFVDGVLLHNASRYWVGGTASWDGTAGTKWAATSGGAGGSSIPTSSDDVFLDGSSGSGTVTIATGNTNCLSLDCTGFTGTLAGSAAISIFGNCKFVSGMTLSYTGTFTFASTSTGRTVTMGSKTIAGNVIFNGSGGEWKLQDTFATSGASSLITLTTGTLDINSKSVTIRAFNTNGTGVRSLVDTGAGGTITLTGNNATIWEVQTFTNLTFGTLNPIICNYSGSTGTRTIRNAPSGGASKALSFRITAGTDIIAGGTNGCVFQDLDFTGFAGTINTTRTIYGNLTIPSGVTVTTSAALTLAATSGTKTISISSTIGASITIDGVGGTFQLGATLNSTSTLTVTNGTFLANGFNINVLSFASSNSNTRTVNLSGITLTTTGINGFSVSTSTNLTFTAPSLIHLNHSSASVGKFLGGGKTYNNVKWTTASTGNLSVTGNNTIAEFYITGTGTGIALITGSNNFTVLKADTPPHTLRFTAGTTQTITPGGWQIKGSVGNLMTIQSSTTTNFILSMASGVVNTDYLSIADSTAQGGATWYAGPNSTDAGGGNVGWIFTAAEMVITKSSKYCVATTPAAVTKSLKYTVTTEGTPITKSIQYAVASENAATKSLKYAVIAPAATTRSLKYAVVIEQSAITKGLGYYILKGSAETKSIQYVITASNAVSKTLQYEISAEYVLTKSIAYAVNIGSVLNKTLLYAVVAKVPVTKGLQYSILIENQLTKTIKYNVLLEQSISKSLLYFVRSDSKVTKILDYKVTDNISIQKTVSYTIQTSQITTKAVVYQVQKHNALSLGMLYAIDEKHQIDKALQYAVLQNSSKQNDLVYKVLAHAKSELGLKYTVLTDAAITRPMVYIIVERFSITKPLIYHMRVNPYNPKPNPYYKKDGIYSPKQSPFTQKTNPYSSKNPVYTPFPPNH